MPDTNLTAREEQIIAAAKPEAAPHFNDARIVGILPGTAQIAETWIQPLADGSSAVGFSIGPISR